MRKSLLVATILSVSSLAATALADPPAPAAVSPPPASSSFPEFAGGAGNVVTPRLYRDGLWAGAPKPERVFAVVGDHVVSGDATPDVSGVLRLRDESRPSFVCGGRWRAGTSGGLSVRLACSDGARVSIALQEFSDDAGFGRRAVGNAPASLCYGFRAKYAAQRLVAPSGYELVAGDNQIVLKRSGV